MEGKTGLAMALYSLPSSMQYIVQIDVELNGGLQSE
jgi:hypothetical protein